MFYFFNKEHFQWIALLRLLGHHYNQPVWRKILRIQERVTGTNLEKMLCSDRPVWFDLFDLSKTSRAVSQRAKYPQQEEILKGLLNLTEMGLNKATTWKFSLDTAGQKLPAYGSDRDQTKDWSGMRDSGRPGSSAALDRIFSTSPGAWGHWGQMGTAAGKENFLIANPAVPSPSPSLCSAGSTRMSYLLLYIIWY